MQVHFGLETLNVEWPECVACIGTFDGVHLGHREVISKAVDKASAKDQPCALITFDRHPAATLAPEKCPPAISSLSHNLIEFGRLGVGMTVVLPFDRRLSETTAEDFFADFLKARLRCGHIALGYDFAFGKDRLGTPEWLGQHIETTVVPRFNLDGTRVSSTSIRAAVSDGRVEDAARWLGRPFSVEGFVVSGQRLGRELGFPTINIARSFHQVTPGDGVYAGVCHNTFGAFRAAIAIGVRPAVGGGPRTIEAHLLDFPGNSLYGKPVVIEVRHRLRDETDFGTVDELKMQMAKDIDCVMSVVKL